MADPLSVAAGVVGLLSAAAQVSLILTDIISKTRHAPRECQMVRIDVEDIRNVLTQLQLYIMGAKQAPRSNRALIMVDQVAATLASCILTFDELKLFTEGLYRESTMGILDRLRWVTKQRDIEDYQSRLGIHKSSLTLMLAILNSQKQDDAEAKVDQLCIKVDQIYKNQLIAMRMAAYDMSQLEQKPSTMLSSVRVSHTVDASTRRKPLPTTSSFARTITGHQYEDHVTAADQEDYELRSYAAAKVYGNNVISGSARVHQGDVYLTNYYTYQDNDAFASLNTPPGNAEARAVTEENIQRDAKGFAFEELLVNSRAYRNAAHNNEEAFSVMSSAGRTATWSMLSGLSLSEMSNIAILAIPVYATDLNDKEGYDFEPPRTEAAVGASHPALSPSQSPGSSRSKRSIKNWWKQFQTEPKTDLQLRLSSSKIVFGVALQTSILYANVAISLMNDQGESFIYGYIPIIVGKCCVFLKQKGKLTQTFQYIANCTGVEDIFFHQGNAARITNLQTSFDKPNLYGKGLDWTGFTVHDAAGVLLRYLKSLPEPVIPYQFYDLFARPIHTYQSQYDASNHVTEALWHSEIISAYQKWIADLPPLNRQLLLYLLDMLAVFASKADVNKMTTNRLAGTFNPALLSRRPAEMGETEHRLAQDVIIFLIENQDNFLIGMTGTTTESSEESESGNPANQCLDAQNSPGDKEEVASSNRRFSRQSESTVQ